jgi:hypothetical protein
VTVHLIHPHGQRRRLSAASAADGFGPRLPGLRERLVNRSSRFRKRSSPSGRPMLSAARSRANRSASGSLAKRSAKSGKRSRIGASAVTPSSHLVHCHRNSV